MSWYSLHNASFKKKQFSEFNDAIKKGQARAIAEVENALFNDAITPGLIVPKIFYLKNRAKDKWKDKVEVDNRHRIDIQQAIKEAEDLFSDSGK